MVGNLFSWEQFAIFLGIYVVIGTSGIKSRLSKHSLLNSFLFVTILALGLGILWIIVWFLIPNGVKNNQNVKYFFNAFCALTFLLALYVPPFNLIVSKPINKIVEKIVPTAIFAATPGQTPTFTWAQPAPYVYFNSITDNPYWGNEQQFVKIVDASGNLVNSVNVQDGKTYTVEMLVHNDLSLGLKPDAQNVMGGLGYDTANDGTSVTVTGVVRTSNAGAMTQDDGTVLSVGGNGQWTAAATFNGSSNFKLSYVPGTAAYTTQFAAPDYTTGGTTFQLPDSTINTGTVLGFNSMDGNIPGCWKYHGILTAKFIAHFD